MYRPSKLLIDESPLQVLPSLALAIGLNEAIFTQQLHYLLRERPSWTDDDGCAWVEKTYAEWRRDVFPFWSERTIQRTALAVERRGLVVAGQRGADQLDHGKSYTLDYAAVAALETNAIDRDNLAPSIATTWHHRSRQPGMILKGIKSLEGGKEGTPAPATFGSEPQPNHADQVLDVWAACRGMVPTDAERVGLQALARSYGYDALITTIEAAARAYPDGSTKPFRTTPQAINLLRSMLKRAADEGRDPGSDTQQYQQQQQAVRVPPPSPALDTTPPADTHHQHPAVAAYVQAFGVVPNAAQAQAIREQVQDQSAWTAILREWALNNWKAGSVGAMLERYRKQARAASGSGGLSKAEYSRLMDALSDANARRDRAAAQAIEHQIKQARAGVRHA